MTYVYTPANESARINMSKEDAHKDKALFVNNFANLLGQTREDVLDLILSEDGNTITIEYDGGYQRDVNIHNDSDVALMIDVLNHLL